MIVPETLPAAGTTLIPIARSAIAGELGLPYRVDESASWLREPGATFVTLTQYGRLRGCIGSLEAFRPLLLDVKANAIAAAFRDPRFSPLCMNELGITEIEVSLLSPTQPLHVTSQEEAMGMLRPGIDGVVFRFGGHHSTFLPQVWEQLPTPEAFLGRLKQKSGLPASFWNDAVQLDRYTVTTWKESELPPAAMP